MRLLPLKWPKIDCEAVSQTPVDKTKKVMGNWLVVACFNVFVHGAYIGFSFPQLIVLSIAIPRSRNDLIK